LTMLTCTYLYQSALSPHLSILFVPHLTWLFHTLLFCRSVPGNGSGYLDVSSGHCAPLV
jgi:hypothetical protein